MVLTFLYIFIFLQRREKCIFLFSNRTFKNNSVFYANAPDYGSVTAETWSFKHTWGTGTLFLFCMMSLHLPVLMYVFNTQVLRG